MARATVGVERLQMQTDMRIGMDARLRIDEMLEEIGAGRAFVVCGRHFARGPLYDGFVSALGVGHAGTFVSEATHGSAQELRPAVETLSECGADVIVAVGGGSVLGFAKAVAVALRDPSPFEQYTGAFQFEHREEQTPIVALPTNAGSGSEVNRFGGVTDSERAVKIRANQLPQVALLDPVLTESLDAFQTVATGANALSHCFEAAYARGASPISVALARAGAALLGRSMPRCVAGPGDLEARQDQLVGSALSSLAFTKNDNAAILCLNAAFGHALGWHERISSAVGNLVMLPITLRRNAQFSPAPIVEVAVELGLLEPGTPGTPHEAARAADLVGEWLRAMSGEIRLRDSFALGDLDEIIEHTLQDSCLSANPGPPVDGAEIRSLLDEAW